MFKNGIVKAPRGGSKVRMCAAPPKGPGSVPTPTLGSLQPPVTQLQWSQHPLWILLAPAHTCALFKCACIYTFLKWSQWLAFQPHRSSVKSLALFETLFEIILDFFFLKSCRSCSTLCSLCLISFKFPFTFIYVCDEEKGVLCVKVRACRSQSLLPSWSDSGRHAQWQVPLPPDPAPSPALGILLCCVVLRQDLMSPWQTSYLLSKKKKKKM